MARYTKLNGVWRLEDESWREMIPPLDGPSSAPTLSFPLGSRPRPPTRPTPDGWLFDLTDAAAGGSLRLDLRYHDKQLTVYPDSSPWKPERKDPTRDRKPRQIRVTIELPGTQDLDRIVLPYDGSPIRLIFAGMLVRPSKTVVEAYFERPERPEKGPKILNRFVLLEEPPYHDPNAILLLYDRLYAIDTDTKTLPRPSGKKLSISSICVGHARPIPSEYFLQAWIAGSGLSLDAPEKPELKAWQALFRRLLPGNGHHGGRTGIIVDSELGYLSKYDHRGGPFDFIYASGDSGGDQFGVNYMISLCHSHSSMIWNVAKTKTPSEIEVEIERQKNRPAKLAIS